MSLKDNFSEKIVPSNEQNVYMATPVSEDDKLDTYDKPDPYDNSRRLSALEK